MSAYELADKYGHNRGTIMKYLTGVGVRSRVAVPTDEEVFRWQELQAEGLGFKTIARRVGRNHKTVRKHLSAPSRTKSTASDGQAPPCETPQTSEFRSGPNRDLEGQSHL